MAPRNTLAVGSIGEATARRFLEGRGLRFLHANWRCKLGEIDLIMDDGSTRVFVEVRLRHETQYADPLETVAYQKQAKLIRTAKLYQQLEEYWGDVRFDVVAITIASDGKPAIEHVPDAFMA